MSDHDPVTRGDLRRVLEALRPVAAGCVGRPSVDAAIAALGPPAPAPTPPTPLGPLPVPGVDGCPSWARWIAWDRRDGRCFLYETRPNDHGAFYAQYWGEDRCRELPPYESTARAGECIPLVEPQPAAEPTGIDWQARAEQAERDLKATRDELFTLRNRYGCGPEQGGPDALERLEQAERELDAALEAAAAVLRGRDGL